MTSEDEELPIMELLTARATVLSFEKRKNGFYEIALQQNLPFQTNFLVFYPSMKQDKHKVDGRIVEPGDNVVVTYYIDINYPIISSIKMAHMGYHHECVTCHAFLPARLAQQTEENVCCRQIGFDDQRYRFDKTLKLVIKTIKKYQCNQEMVRTHHSCSPYTLYPWMTPDPWPYGGRNGMVTIRGLHLLFSDDSTGETYSLILYENHPLFRINSNLELLNSYKVVAWKGKNNSALNLIQIM